MTVVTGRRRIAGANTPPGQLRHCGLGGLDAVIEDEWRRLLPTDRRQEQPSRNWVRSRFSSEDWEGLRKRPAARVL
jgi:hypothetical protein